MGGIFCSMWWTFTLGASLSRLDIPALELIAVGIDFIMFGDVIAQLLREHSNVVVAFIDAQASPQLLVKTGTTSFVMSRVLQRIRALPSYVKSKVRVAVAHTYGEGNELSDDTSGDKFEELKAYCVQTGVKDKKLDILPEVDNFIAGIWEDLEADRWVPSRSSL